MADFALPNLGENINEADVLKILVSEGDVITVDQPLLEIETEKATLDVPSEMAGRVTKIHVTAGDVVKPGQLLLSVETGASATPAAAPAAPAEQAPAPAAAAEAAPAPAAATPEPAAPAAAAPAAPAAPPPPAPAATNLGRQPAASDDATTPPPADMPVFAAPSTRHFAREVGVDLRGVVGTGPGGRITEDDVKRHAREQTSRPIIVQMSSAPAGSEVEKTPLPDFGQWGEVTREPLTRLRRTVVRNMAQSWSEIPHVHLYHHADITALESLRQQWKARAQAAGGNLTISVMLLKIVAAALRAHPRINASLDTETNELIVKKYVHLGVAVDTERGLVVPKIENVDQKNIIELSVELNEIAGRARDNALTIEEQRGATFTITNLGSLGTGYFDPIINWPEIAILGLGRAEQTAVWVDGEWKPQLRMPLSFGMDHRIIDGADGARFMSWIVEAIKNPMIMALEG
jgi:pyruvate dehydrogenase E2 component (dihydrolipoamide acetyltransferase)